MSARERAGQGSVAVHDGELCEPVPVRGCGVCQVLVQDRELAWKVGNLEAVAEQNAVLRSHHPHGQTQGGNPGDGGLDGS
ncbi:MULTISPECIES: hypothetical protein [unclassified Streptomyces]|uniref:hypothetical protein n=1 Tax=unclassified Streptomyces TaxID=2593676 RepID=UPI0034268319